MPGPGQLRRLPMVLAAAAVLCAVTEVGTLAGMPTESLLDCDPALPDTRVRTVYDSTVPSAPFVSVYAVVPADNVAFTDPLLSTCTSS